VWFRAFIRCLKRFSKRSKGKRENPVMRVIKKMERRGWLLLASMVLVSLFWRDAKVTLGVLLGGGIALADIWLIRTLFSKLVKEGRGKALFVVQIVKYLIIAVVLGILFFFKLVSPLAVLAGLSLLVFMPLIGLPRLKRELEEVA